MTFDPCANGVCPPKKGTDTLLHITSDPNNFGFAVKSAIDPEFTGAQIKCSMTERPCAPAPGMNGTAAGDPNEKVHTILCQVNSKDTKTFPYTFDEHLRTETLSAKSGLVDLAFSHDLGHGQISVRAKTGFLNLDLGVKHTNDYTNGAKSWGHLYLPGLEIQTSTKLGNMAENQAATAIKMNPDAKLLRDFMDGTKGIISQKEVSSEFSTWAYPAMGGAAACALFCGYKTYLAVEKSLVNNIKPEQKTKATREALIYGTAMVASMILGGVAFVNGSHCPSGATGHAGKCYSWHVFSPII